VSSAGLPRVVGLLSTKQSILVKHTDIYEIGQLVLQETIFSEHTADDAEPDIEIKL
jgi:hypothetical protein